MSNDQVRPPNEFLSAYHTLLETAGKRELVWIEGVMLESPTKRGAINHVRKVRALWKSLKVFNMHRLSWVAKLQLHTRVRERDGQWIFSVMMAEPIDVLKVLANAR